MSQPEKPTSTNAVATVETALARPVTGLPTPSELDLIERLGQTYHASGLLPAGVRNWQAAVIAIQAGRELGIPPTVAVREIYVVSGRPTCSAQLMMSLIRRAYGPGAIRVKEATDTGCTVEYREPGWDGVGTFTFSEEDAKRAGLTQGKNVNWKSYPRAMYRSRAVSEVARMVFPDAILGMYTPDEMGAPVDEEGRIVVSGTVIDHDTGEVIDAPARTQSRQNRPARAEVVEEVSEDALPRLLRVAGKAGITEAQLEGWAVSKGCATIGAVPPAALASIADKIERNTEVAVGFFEKYTPTVDAADVIDIPTEAPTATPLEIDGLDELNAAADRDLAAVRARA